MFCLYRPFRGINARGINARGINARGINARGINARGINGSERVIYLYINPSVYFLNY